MGKDRPVYSRNVQEELGPEQHASVDEKLREMFQLIGAEVRKVNQSCENLESKTHRHLQKFKEELRKESRSLQEQVEHLSVQLERERNVIAEQREQLDYLSTSLQSHNNIRNNWYRTKEDGMESSNPNILISSAFWTVARWFYLIFICVVKGAHFVVQPLVDTVEIMTDNFLGVKAKGPVSMHDEKHNSLIRVLHFPDDVTVITGQTVFVASAFCKMESSDGSLMLLPCELLQQSDISTSVLQSDVDITFLMDTCMEESLRENSVGKFAACGGEYILPLYNHAR